MLKKLELDALRADLAAVAALLAQRSEEIDPVGWMQLTERKAYLEAELARLDKDVSATAGVAIFFGGKPVIGSRGVSAEFGAKALQVFQDLVATEAASSEGPLGRRGPVPLRDRTQLMITDVARGSVGFVLEEFGENSELLETTLRGTVGRTCDFIYRFGAPDEEVFGAATEQVDDRLLGQLRSFFRLLDDSGATLRIVEDERDFSLARPEVELGRRRTDALNLSERTQEILGTLYVLPDAKRFELHPSVGGESLRGAISPELIRRIVSEDHEVRPELIGRPLTLRVRIKEAVMQNREPRRSFTLIDVAEVGGALLAPNEPNAE